MKIKLILTGVICFTLGILIGGYIFTDVQPRSIIALQHCNQTCLNPNELTGLLASIGIQHAGKMLPQVLEETDKKIVFKNPMPQVPVHYLIDMFAVMSNIIQREHLSKYQIATNGPGFQAVNYLHFHLMANGKKLAF